MNRFIAILLLVGVVFSVDAAPVIGRRIATPATVAAGGTTLLLDESGLGSASAAYSVRKLRSAYSGSALRVRRSSDSTEQDIGFSGNDLDTASLESFCAATDGFVVTWYDQSGNGRNITQSTAANQPKIVSSGTIITGANSKPTVVFDGSNDNLQMSGTFSVSTALFTQYVLFKIDTWTSNGGIFSAGQLAGSRPSFRMHNAGGSANKVTAFGGDGSERLLPTGGLDWGASAYSLASITWNGTTNSTFGKNNDSETTGNLGNETSSSMKPAMGVWPWASAYGAVRIQEAILYTATAHDGTARATAKSNVNAYFSLY